ncbi:hypothetical protein EDB85DRAFT_2071892 [Lactarius pseudohatsudake]|nr:hypothetical protein EDB85DRAFT_2071892 [Lactarius pseudohatsudake]
MTQLRTQLLKLAVPLVRHHGFTRTALARSSQRCLARTDTARRTLISAWLEHGRSHMRSVPVEGVKGALLARLEYNVPVLEHLPEVPLLHFVASPRLGVPPLDPRPAVQHAVSVADEACRAVKDASIGPSWYTMRITLAAVYASAVQSALTEAEIFTQYVAKSWVAIAKNSGVF